MRIPSVLVTGPALRLLRMRRGMKQNQVAQKTGISAGNLSSYETGRCRPTLDTLSKILEATESNLEDLHNAVQAVASFPRRETR